MNGIFFQGKMFPDFGGRFGGIGVGLELVVEFLEVEVLRLVLLQADVKFGVGILDDLQLFCQTAVLLTLVVGDPS